MKRLGIFVALLSLLPNLVLAQVQPLTVTLVQPGQPSSGGAYAGQTVAAVAVTVRSNSLAHISAIKVQKVGSLNAAAIANLEVNTDANTVVGTANGFDANNEVSIPVSATTDSAATKTFLVSAVMASNLTSYVGQSFELNITAVTTDAVVSNGTLPIYGAQFTVSSNAQKPTCSMSASSGTYQIGQTVNIRWTSTNATGGTITGIGTVGPSGLQGILPGGQSQTLVGTFTGPGGTGTCSLTLTLTSANGGVISTGGGVDNAGNVSGPGTIGGGASGGTITPGTQSGGTGSTVNTPTTPTAQGSLLPCSGLDCRLCDFAALAQNIINYLIGLTIPLAAVMFAWAGILYFTSATKPANIERARAIFKVVFWGFLIAIGAWLMVQTFLRFTLGSNYNWNTIQCSANSNRPGSGQPGSKSTDASSFFSNIGGLNLSNPNAVALNTSGGSNTSSTGGYCPSGSTFSSSINGCVDKTTGECTYSDCSANANAYVKQNFTGGGCNGLSAQGSCIAKIESSCNPLLGSGVDVGSDGSAVSWGLFQVNLSANSLQCNGQTLNCPSAFGGGTYTSKNHGTYVKDQLLYNQCVNLAQDPSCSEQMYQSLKAERNGSIRAWGNAAYNACSNL